MHQIYLESQEALTPEDLQFSVQADRELLVGDGTTDKSNNEMFLPLEKELHASILQFEESPHVREIGQRKLVINEDGSCSDVQFAQDGHDYTLKQFLPGEYTIRLVDKPVTRQSDGAFYNVTQQEVYVNRSCFRSESEYNLALLHEAGHALDEVKNKVVYKPSDDKRAFYTFVSLAAQAQATALNLGASANHAYYRNALIAHIGKENMLIHSLDSFLSAIDETTPETLVDLQKKMGFQARREQAEFAVQRERHAWAYALQVLRSLRKVGVNLYAGSNKELVESVDTALSSYQAGLGHLTSNNERFVKRLV